MAAPSSLHNGATDARCADRRLGFANVSFRSVGQRPALPDEAIPAW